MAGKDQGIALLRALGNKIAGLPLPSVRQGNIGCRQARNHDANAPAGDSILFCSASYSLHYRALSLAAAASRGVSAHITYVKAAGQASDRRGTDRLR